LYVAQLPQYTGVKQQSKKRKLNKISEDISGVKIEHVEKVEEIPHDSVDDTSGFHAPPPPNCGTGALTLACDEPPQLVDSPKSVASPVSSVSEDGTWEDRVFMEQTDEDPVAMLSELMYEQSSSPLDEADSGGFFGGEVEQMRRWCSSGPC